MGGRDAFVTASNGCVAGPEPCIRAGVAVPCSHENFVLPVSLQVNLHFLYDEKIARVRNAVWYLHCQIVRNRVRYRVIPMRLGDDSDACNPRDEQNASEHT